MKPPFATRKPPVKTTARSTAVSVRSPKTQELLPAQNTPEEFSAFSERIADINHAIDSGQNMEGASFQLYSELLKITVKAVPNLEIKLKNGTGRDVYAFAALVDTSLKLTNETRSLQDRSAMSKLLMDQIIRPQLELMARKIVADINKGKMRLDAHRDVVAVNTLDEVRESLVASIGTMFSDVSGQLQEYFGGSATGERLDV